MTTPSELPSPDNKKDRLTNLPGTTGTQNDPLSRESMFPAQGLKASPEKKITFAQGKYTFAGDRETIRNHEENIADIQRKAKALAVDRNETVKACAYIGTIIGGLTEVPAHITTGGQTLIFMGKVAAGGALTGAAIGRWISGSEDSSQLVSEASTLAKERQRVLSRLEKAVRLNGDIEQISFAAKSAATTEALSKDLLKKFFEGFNSEYCDVQMTVAKALPILQKTPGAKELLKDIDTKHFSVAVHQLWLDTQPGQPLDKRLWALQRLYPLEKEVTGTYKVSVSAYTGALSDSDPAIAAQALRAMFEEPALRPVDFRNRVERAIKSQDPLLKEVAVTCLPQFQFPSGTIDLELKRLSNPAQAPNMAVYQAAVEALADREAKGIYRRMIAVDIRDRLAGFFESDPDFRKSVVTAVAIYKGPLANSQRTLPNLRLHVTGEHSDIFTRKFAQEMFAGEESLVDIDLGSVNSPDALRLRLYMAEPLAGKLIYFRNLQALDKMSNKETQQGIIEYLKPIFDQEEPLKDLSFKDSVVAVSSEIRLEDLECLKAKTLGEPLRNRIGSFAIPVRVPKALAAGKLGNDPLS